MGHGPRFGNIGQTDAVQTGDGFLLLDDFGHHDPDVIPIIDVGVVTDLVEVDIEIRHWRRRGNPSTPTF